MLRIKKSFIAVLLLLVLGSFAVFAEDSVYGAKGVDSADGLTLEKMLNYAIQDEYLARAEYELIMKKYGVIRPFSNIIRAEQSHISWVSAMLEKYGFSVPKDTAQEHVVVPSSMEAALETGVQAEIDNIAMYEKFLTQDDLPADIRNLFLRLQRGSRNHLRAFQNNLRASSKNH